MKEIPYGVSDYSSIRRNDMAYIDKTRFIAELEKAGRFLFFLRPRRSGKSLMLSTLYSYYDRNNVDRFEALFGKTWIGNSPTPERCSYLILAFNFSVIRPEPDKVEASFEENVRRTVENFTRLYPEVFDDVFRASLARVPTPESLLGQVFDYCSRMKQKLYILIDEYDNFTNTILASHGKEQYQRVTHGSGFLRNFFNVLKGGTSMQDSGLERLFITGVSPVTMDDVTSGFNIGTQVSLEPQFEACAGFTEEEVRRTLASYQIPEKLGWTMEQVMGLVGEWYGGYRFTRDSENEIFNPDMVYYFTRAVTRYGRLPDELIDQNVRIDYSKLRHLLIVEKQLNGNFELLKSVMETGQLSSSIVQSFPLEELTRQENFISLLYYLGLLTHGEKGELDPILSPPNRTITSLIWKQLRDAYEDNRVFRVDQRSLQQTLKAMALEGDWQPFFEQMAQAVMNYTTIRDYLHGEKVIQGFLLAYLSCANYFNIQGERERNKGYCDIFMEPFLSKYPQIGHGYLIELKYIKRNEALSEDLLEKKLTEARDQLKRYREDKSLAQIDVTWHAVTLIFHGWELVKMDELP